MRRCLAMANNIMNIKVEDTLSSTCPSPSNIRSLDLADVVVKKEPEDPKEDCSFNGTAEINYSFDFTEDHIRDVKEEKVDVENGASSVEKSSVLTSYSHSIDTSILVKEEDLGVDVEEGEETPQADFDFSISFQNHEDPLHNEEFYIAMISDKNGLDSQVSTLSSSVDSKPLVTKFNKTNNLDDLVATDKLSFPHTFRKATSKNLATKNHLAADSRKKPYSCADCSAKFKTKSELKQHSFSHSNVRPFSCPHCAATCNTKRNLNSHLLVHSNVKPFSCAHCAATFKAKRYLRQHLVSHSDARPFSCTQCKYTCKTESGLKNHSIVHSGVKRFACCHCAATFRTKKILEKHLIVHSNVKAFSCLHCSAKFRTRFKLQVHLLTHSYIRLFPCAICDSSLKTKHALQLHSLRKHSDVRTFTCTHCGSAFKTKMELKDHSLVHSNR